MKTLSRNRPALSLGLLVLMIICVILLAFRSVPAFAGNSVLWSPQIGDVVFPFSPPNVNGPGSIDNMNLGLATPGAIVARPLSVDNGTKTATATSGAATLNKNAGVITSESLTTAAGSDYTLTLTDSVITASDQVFASAQLGTSTTGEPAITSVTPSAGQVVILVRNIAASAAFNGTIKISFMRLQN